MTPAQKNASTLKVETTTLWDFPTQNYGDRPHGDNKFSGVTPAFVVWNLVQRYTKKGDLVVDPMCGSGTTIDVCEEEGRRVIGFDIVPHREDIRQADARALPLDDEVAEFAFIDSPYSDNLNYNDNPQNIGRISCEKPEFFVALRDVANEACRILKHGGHLAWLIGDHWRRKSGFIPVGIRLYSILEECFTPVDLVCVTRHNQTSNTPLWHRRAVQHNFFLRGFKHLIIVRKAGERDKPALGASHLRLTDQLAPKREREEFPRLSGARIPTRGTVSGEPPMAKGNYRDRKEAKKPKKDKKAKSPETK